MPGRIMIIDDDTDLQEVCGLVWKAKSYEVYGMNHCNDVLREVKACSPDIILMDNWIPDAGGVKAIQEIKRDSQLKNIPVIFFSANDHVDALAAESGAEFFLAKPFEIDDLENVISKAFEFSGHTEARQTL